MVSFDPISLIVEAVSQVGIYFIDKDTQNSIQASKELQLQYQAQAEASKEDAELYLLLTAKANKQKEQTTLLTNQAIQNNKVVVYTVWLVFFITFITLYLVLKFAFNWVSKTKIPKQ